MASFAPIRGTRSEINATNIVDGQFLIETDSEDPNNERRIYFDVGTDRVVVGGGGANDLGGLADVDATTTQSPSNDSILKYDSNVNMFVCGSYLDEWSPVSQVQTSGNNLIVVFDNLDNNYAYELFYENGVIGIVSATEETGTQPNTKKITYILTDNATAGANCKLRIVK